MSLCVSECVSLAFVSRVVFILDVAAAVVVATNRHFNYSATNLLHYRSYYMLPSFLVERWAWDSNCSVCALSWCVLSVHNVSSVLSAVRIVWGGGGGGCWARMGMWGHF